MSEYTNIRLPPKTSELQVYTWLDATLSELTSLIREIPDYQDKGTQFFYSIVFPEPNSASFRMRPIGVTIAGKRGPNDDLKLGQCRYQIGDFLDVAIIPAGAELPRVINNPRLNKRRRNRNIGSGHPQSRVHNWPNELKHLQIVKFVSYDVCVAHHADKQTPYALFWISGMVLTHSQSKLIQNKLIISFNRVFSMQERLFLCRNTQLQIARNFVNQSCGHNKSNVFSSTHSMSQYSICSESWALEARSLEVIIWVHTL